MLGIALRLGTLPPTADSLAVVCLSVAVAPTTRVLPQPRGFEARLLGVVGVEEHDLRVPDDQHGCEITGNLDT